MKRTVVVSLIVLALVAACSSKESGGPTDTPSGAPPSRTLVPGDPAAALRMIQDAVNRAGSYTIAVTQSNVSLPQWGGSDGGSVEVSKGGSVAVAKLVRTGEADATYTITRSNGQTFFKRSTCDETFRVPSGGGDVLMPFLFQVNDAIANARNPRFATPPQSGDAAVRIVDELPYIGEVTIEVDGTTLLPRRILGPTGNKTLLWELSGWGKTNVSVSVPSKVQDRGPGGIPC